MEQSRHGQGITSVKVHHPSGGASSFSLGHDDAGDDRWGNNGKVGGAAAATRAQAQPVQNTYVRNQHHDNNNVIGGGYQEETKGPAQNSTEQRGQAPDAGPGAFTSVKYSGNPPGGKSSITF